METLETNVAKIHIGNNKQTNTFVASIAERTVHPDCEIFAVVSLPVLNPAAIVDCERIAESVIAALRRCFKRASNDSTFEVALGEINDEVGKLASLGQQTWTGKLSAVIAARRGSHLNVAATGKANALLLRGGEFNEITESTNAKHPLKTFDTFSTGRVRVGDLVILTTAELFNYVSVDRLKNIVNTNTLEIAAQEVVRVLEDTAGPEVAFSTLLLQETEPLIASPDGIDLNEYNSTGKQGGLLQGVSGAAKKIISKDAAKALWDSLRKVSTKRPNLDMKKLSTAALATGSQGLSLLKTHAQSYKHINYKAPLESFKNFSRPKQFFTVSVVVLLLAVIVNIFVARSHRQTANTASQFSQASSTIQKLISDADSKLVFKDNAGALMTLAEAKEKLQSLTTTSQSQTQAKSEFEKQILELQKKIEKIETPNVETLATLSNAEKLIALPNLLATATGKVVVSYNTNTKTTEDGTLKTANDIVDSVYISGTSAAIFDGQGLELWNFSSGQNSSPFFLNVPKANNFVGLVRFPTNNRVYIVDTSLGQVISYLVTGENFSKPLVSVKNPELTNAQDLALDGSVYVLLPNGVNKYTAGKQVSFSFPALSEQFSGQGKLFTTIASKQLYILDTNGRVIITDKTGKLLKILQASELKGATDFTVDEANKTIYLLRSGSLLKINFSL